MPKLTEEEKKTVRHFKAFLMKQPIHSAQVFMIAYGKDAVILSDLFEHRPELFERLLEEYATRGGWEADAK